MNRIVLSLGPDCCWLATFEGEHAAEVEAAFGCRTLPTPFTAAADPDRVRRTIAWLNPGAVVVMLNATEEEPDRCTHP